MQLTARLRSRRRNAEAISGDWATPGERAWGRGIHHALLATFLDIVKYDFSIWQAVFPDRRKRLGKLLIRLAES